MDDSVLKHLYDVLTAARAILEFTKGLDYDDYCVNDILSSAVERKFEIIGEGLNRIKKKDPSVLELISDYRSIIDFRNILAHAYDHIEDSVVWGIIERHLPCFVKEIEAIDGLDEDI